MTIFSGEAPIMHPRMISLTFEIYPAEFHPAKPMILPRFNITFTCHEIDEVQRPLIIKMAFPPEKSVGNHLFRRGQKQTALEIPTIGTDGLQLPFFVTTQVKTPYTFAYCHKRSLRHILPRFPPFYYVKSDRGQIPCSRPSGCSRS